MNPVPAALQPKPQPVMHTMPGSLRQNITFIIAGRWMALHDIRQDNIIRNDDWSSEASISARIRELTWPEFGAWPVQKRRVPGKHYFEYRLDV